MKIQFSIGVFGIIFDEQMRVLLCHRRDYDLWNLPGGALEAGEAPWEGVKREILEETGLNVDVTRLLGVYSKTDKNEIVFSFLCKPVSGEITLNEEADKIAYFETDRLPANMSAKQIERVKDALCEFPSAILKKQAGKSSIELIKEGKL